MKILSQAMELSVVTYIFTAWVVQKVLFILIYLRQLRRLKSETTRDITNFFVKANSYASQFKHSIFFPTR